MTVLQLKVAVAVAELRSVSSAAKLMNISQPNASNSLRLLEDELGFPVFLRTGAGTTLTPKGAEFLVYARRILDANDKAMNLRHMEEVYRLHLGTSNYYAAAEPFFTLCTEHRDDTNTDFLYLSVSVAEGIKKLSVRGLDIVAAPVLKHQIAPLYRECKRAGIEIHSICEVPAVIMVRRNHPAALDGRCAEITQGCDTMKTYPYIGFKNLNDDSGSTGYNDSDFIQCSSKVFADSANVRLRLIEAGNGFGFGVQTSDRLMSQYDIVAFPVKGVTLELFCLIRPGEAERREIREYMTLLKKEMLLMLK